MFQKILLGAKDIIVLSIFALVVLIVQWKTVRALNMINNLLLYYGKQIEEIKRMVSSGASAAAMPREIGPTEPRAKSGGMYEILMEPEPPAKPPPKAPPKA